MKKSLIILFFSFVSACLFAQADTDGFVSKTTNGASVYTGLQLKNYFSSDTLVWKVGGNTVSAHSIFGTNAAYDLIFRTNSTERMRILAGGNVGIGTSSPTTKLDVQGTGGLNVNTTNGGSGYTDWLAGNFGAAAGDRVAVGLLNGKALIGGLTNTLAAWSDLTINSGGGNVGVGTTSPSERLEVGSGNILLSNNYGLKIKNNSGTAVTALSLSVSNVFSAFNDALSVSSTNDVSITSNRTNIGGSASTQSLHYGSVGLVLKPSTGDRALLELHSPTNGAVAFLQTVDSYGFFIQSANSLPTIVTNNLFGSFLRIGGSNYAEGIRFSSSHTATDDVGIGRVSAGVLRITNASTGYGSLQAGAIDVTSNKITSLANGTASTDAAAFGQIATGINTAVSGTSGFLTKFTGTNTIGNSILSESGSVVASSGSITAASGFSTNGTTAIGAGGAFLQWNRSGGNGETWLINQVGGGNANGIRFGSATTSNVVTEWARFDASGNFGIGITPTTKLDVNGVINLNTNKITNLANGTASTDAVNKSQLDAVSNAGFQNGGNSFGATAVLGTNDAYDLRFRTNSGTGAVLGNNKMFGIGVISPQYKLDVYAGSEGNPIRALGIQASTSAADSNLVIGTNGIIYRSKAVITAATSAGIDTSLIWRQTGLSIISTESTLMTWQNGRWFPQRGFYTLEDVGGNRGTNKAYESFNRAISLGIRQLVIDSAYNILGDITIPSTMTLVIKGNSSISCDAGAILYVNGKCIIETRKQAFYGNGNVIFDKSAIDYLDPMWFGAQNDGGGENATAFNKCFQSAISSGIEVFVKNGTYRSVTGIGLTSSVKMRGQDKYKTLFFIDHNTNTMFYVDGTGGAISGLQFSDFGIICNRSTRSSGYAIEMFTSGDYRFTHLYINSTWNGIRYNKCSSGVTDDLIMSDNIAVGKVNNGLIYENNCIGNTLKHFHFVGSGYGIKLEDGTDTFIGDDCITQYTSTGIAKEGVYIDNTGGVYHNPRWVKFSNCLFEPSTGYDAVYIAKGTNIDFVNCYLTWGLHGYNIAASTAKAITITGGIVQLAEREGIKITGSNSVIIQGVNVNDNSMSSTNTYANIYATDCNVNIGDCMIGNHIWNGDNPSTGGVETISQKAGVELGSNVNYLIRNQYIGLTGKEVVTTGTGNVNKELNNIGKVYASTSSSYTVLADDIYVTVTNEATNVTITFPKASDFKNRLITVKRGFKAGGAASTGTVTLTPTTNTTGQAGNIEKLDGVYAASFVLAAQGVIGSTVTFRSNGAEWELVSN